MSLCCFRENFIEERDIIPGKNKRNAPARSHEWDRSWKDGDFSEITEMLDGEAGLEVATEDEHIVLNF